MMHRSCLPAALIFPALLVVAPVVTVAAETPAAVDLKPTGELVEGWAHRPSFPESITFAYYTAYAFQALGKQIGPELRQHITRYVSRCQRDNGGFTSEPTYGKHPNVIFTYYGLRTLAMLGTLGEVDREGAVRFLRSLVQKDGGMVGEGKAGERAALAATYYGVEALHLLGALDRLDKKNTVAFVHRYQRTDQGFSVVEGGGSSPQATFMAARTLDLLGALTDEVKAGAIAYLKSTRYSGLVKDKKFSGLPQIQAMTATLEALSVLEAIQEVDAAKVYEFVGSLYIPLNGGFGPRPGVGTTPPSTYHAIACLVRLGKLPDPLAGSAETPASPPKPGTATTPP